jgi:hypothetical protein
MTRITDWRTSTYSGGENNDCVQVANTLSAIRDSKSPDGDFVQVNLHQLVNAIKSGRFGR